MYPIHFSNIYSDLLFNKEVRHQKKVFKEQSLFKILKFYNGQITYSDLMCMNKSDLDQMLKIMNEKIKNNNETIKKIQENKNAQLHQLKYVISLNE